MKSLQKAQWILLSCLFSFVLQSCEGESPGEKIIVGTWGGRAVNEDVDSEWLEEGVDIEVQMIYDFFSDKTGVFRFSFHVEGEVSLLSQILFFGGYQNEQEYSSSLTWRFENGALHANIEEDFDDLFGGPHIKYELIGDSALVHSNWFPLEKIH